MYVDQSREFACEHWGLRRFQCNVQGLVEGAPSSTLLILQL